MRNQSTKEQQIRGQKRDCRSVARSREISFYNLCSLKGKQAIQSWEKKKVVIILYKKEIKVALRMSMKQPCHRFQRKLNKKLLLKGVMFIIRKRKIIFS